MFAILFADLPGWEWVLAAVLAVPLLIGLNGFFVAAEFALVAVRKTRIEELVNQGVSRATAVATAINSLDRTIAATQLGITLTSIALGWVGERSLEHLLRPLFESLPDGLAFFSRHAVATAIAFAAITYLHVVFGELIPKAIALQTPDRTAMFVAGPLNLFSRFTRPIVQIMNGTANRLVRLLGYRPSDAEEEVHSIEELRLLIEDTEEAGLLDADQAAFVMNVFSLSDKTVRDVMIPRDKVAALDLRLKPDQVLDAVREGAHTRMPVFDGSLDEIVGVVNTKDLFYLFSLRGIVVLEDAMYPPQFLHPDAPISVALRMFKRTRQPMAVVREGGKPVLGILTLEDVIEEIVGDIEDEHDDPARRLLLAAKILRRPLPVQKPSTT